MPQKYLLPCPACGATTPVETAQAGSTIACACGAQVDVPGLRQLRDLPTSSDEPPAVPMSTWGLRQGLMLAGLMVFIMGAIPAIYWTVNFPEPPTYDVAGRVAQDSEQIDKMSPLATWILWKQMSEQGLRVEQTPANVAYEQNARSLRIKIAAAGAIALLGLVLAISSLAIRNTTARGVA